MSCVVHFNKAKVVDDSNMAAVKTDLLLRNWPRLAEAFKLFSAFSQEQRPKRKIGFFVLDQYVQALVMAKKLEPSRLQESPGG